MVLLHAKNIPASGLDLQRLQDASSKSTNPPKANFVRTQHSCRALVEDHAPTRLKVYITGDGADVYEDSFLKLARADDGTFTPTLILVGIRLGIDRVTPAYWEALKASLELPQSVGIAG